MNTGQRDEALRLAKESGFIPEDDDHPIDHHTCWCASTMDIEQIIALARASQAQPEPPAGWVLVPKEPTLPMLSVLEKFHVTEFTYRAEFDMNALRTYVAILAAAPSPITGDSGE